MSFRLIAALAACAWTSWGQTAAATVARADCFPVEQLDAGGRAKAEGLFLKMLDSEALYTVIGGTKPMSSGYVWLHVDAGGDLSEVDETRRLLALFHCGGGVFASMQHFRELQKDPKTGKVQRAYEGVVFAVPAMRKAIAAKSAFFGSLGLSPWSSPMEVLTAIEYSDKGPRWRGYGLLYGFPDKAVDFFVEAGLSQERDGKFVPRQFLSHATFARQERGVVYAVPVEHKPDDADAALGEQFRRTLAEYKVRREKFVGEGKAGVVELLRDWFCGSGNRCGAPAAP